MHRLLGPTPALLSALCLVAQPVSVEAQFGSFGGVIAQADRLYDSGDPRGSFERLELHLERDSTDYEALWRAARAAVVLGIEEDDNRNQNAWLDPAIEYSSRAVQERPGAIDGIYWRGVSAGRRAMNAGPGYAVELAQTVYDDAHAILAQDSLHGGAHNMLGKLNYEVMSLSRIKRAIARTFMGNRALDDSSWEAAEHHLAKAAEVWPDFVLFHFDLAQLYRKRGRREEAIRSYARALDLPSVHPTDAGLKAQAREILREWDVEPDSLMVRPTTDGVRAP